MDRGQQSSRGQQPGARTAARWDERDHPTGPHPAQRHRTGLNGPRLREVGAGAVGLAVAVITLLTLVMVARRGSHTADTARPDDVLLLALAWIGVLLAAWLALGCLFAVASLLPGAAGRVAREVADQVTPTAVRKVLTLTLGASVGSIALPPAPVSSAGTAPTARGPEAEPPSAARIATPGLAPGYTPTDLTPGYSPSAGSARSAGSAGPASPSPSADSPLAGLPDLRGLSVDPGYSPTPLTQQGVEAPAPPRPPDGPGYLPTQPVSVLDADRSQLMAPTPRPAASAHDLVTVRRGDSLWTIAARHLGPGASDAQISREWPRWYAANRDVVGEDPDLIMPGVQLRPPSSAPAAPDTHDARASAPRPSSTHVGAGDGSPAQQGAS
ncbi:LysM peptidoglycan-binding domain-containing protein [Terrabacter sp. Ter38]|uniref:LysM peptidoglycan-binding domain-containing protein n=1 Tax=Terrabacter sp. Ter38 TaxID=2926030 RepID=UPI002118CE74|nr:hypothetical protein [Terrabacter sp. Ter38]